MPHALILDMPMKLGLKLNFIYCHIQGRIELEKKNYSSALEYF